MAASTIRQILAYVQGRLAVIDGTGDYTFDLSATGKVIVGDHPLDRPPVSPPCACVWVSDVVSDLGPVLGDREHTGTIGIRGWATHTSANTSSEHLAALDLWSDIHRALTRGMDGSSEYVRSMGGLSEDTALRLDPPNANPADRQVPICEGVLVTNYRTSHGGV